MLQRFSASRLLTPDGWLHDAGLLVRDGAIDAVGPSAELPDRDFFAWRQVLYRYGGQMGAEQLEAGALLTYAEMLLRGVTTVVDFFYIHHDANDGARAAIRAAQRLGLRIGL